MTHRIYLVGAHSTGKTTLARWIRNTYGIPMITEVARGVLAEMEARLESLRSDLGLVNEYQRAVFERQIEIESAQTGSFVSDRAFCNLAYAGQHGTILPDVFGDDRLSRYMETVRSGVVFFLRPHRALMAEDGTRESPDWDEVVRIDGMVKLLLEMFGVPYIPVASLAMQERVRLIERVLHLAGLQCPDRTLTPGSVASQMGMSLPVGGPPAAEGNGNGNGHGELTPAPRVPRENGEPNGHRPTVGA